MLTSLHRTIKPIHYRGVVGPWQQEHLLPVPGVGAQSLADQRVKFGRASGRYHAGEIPAQLADAGTAAMGGQVGGGAKRPSGQSLWSKAQQLPSGGVTQVCKPAHLILPELALQALRRTASSRWNTVTICAPASNHRATSSAKGTPRPVNPAPSNVMM